MFLTVLLYPISLTFILQSRSVCQQEKKKKNFSRPTGWWWWWRWWCVSNREERVRIMQMAELPLVFHAVWCSSLHPSLPGPRLSEWREGVHYARWDREKERERGRTTTSSASIFWQTWERTLFWHTRFGIKGGLPCFEELPVVPNPFEGKATSF